MNFAIIFILTILFGITASFFFAQTPLYTIIDFIRYKSRKKIIEYLGLDVEYVGKVMYITYFKESETFRIAVPIKSGIRPIKNIETKLLNSESDFEMNVRLREFAGPNRDFHGIITTPNMLGIDQHIVVTYSNNIVKEYVKDEVIGVKLPEQK